MDRCGGGVGETALMPASELWALTVGAGSSSAEERRRVARLVEEQIADHPDWLFLGTCHRAELYGVGPIPRIDSRLRLHAGEAAVMHVMRVAAGLESAIVGEDEVLHQVREALRSALAAGPTDVRLQRLFETAVAAGRRARSGRTEASGNLAQAAVAWLARKAPIRGRPVVVAGAGRMGAALAHAAKKAGAEVSIASRDVTKASRLAGVCRGRGVDLSAGAELVPSSAGVAVALAGPWKELGRSAARLPPIADISAPASVPEAIRARLNGGFLGIDDLCERGRPLPRGYVAEAERVVAGKAAEYVAWLATR